MEIEGLTPIRNVSNIVETFEWFAKLGWEKAWDWSSEEGAPPTFGAVCNGKPQIFLCQGGQGSRGGSMPQFVGDDETGGVWMTWWVPSPAEGDAAHEVAIENGMTGAVPPADEALSVREVHLPPPRGHTFRGSAGLR